MHIPSIISWILANGDSLLIVAIVLAALIISLKTGETNALKQSIFAFLTQVEQKYGSGMGAVKFAEVSEWVYNRIPSPLRILFTPKDIENLIEQSLTLAKEKWAKSNALSEYISSNDKPDTTETVDKSNIELSELLRMLGEITIRLRNLEVPEQKVTEVKSSQPNW